MERQTFIYDGDVFEEGELVLVNGKELMYCLSTEKWMGGDAMYVTYVPRYKKVHRYKPKEYFISPSAIKTTTKGDKIQHVYDPEEYNKDLPPQENERTVNSYLIDGWVICIFLMILMLIFKPVGLWSLAVLFIWLHLRNEEIKRIK